LELKVTAQSFSSAEDGDCELALSRANTNANAQGDWDDALRDKGGDENSETVLLDFSLI
jgi:hypothetical protein